MLFIGLASGLVESYSANLSRGGQSRSKAHTRDTSTEVAGGGEFGVPFWQHCAAGFEVTPFYYNVDD